MHVQDSSSSIYKIKKIIQNINIEFSINLITKYKNKEFDFDQDPTYFLIKQCNNEA